MGIGASIFLIALGAILAFALNVDLGGIDIQVIGWILLLAGDAGSEFDLERGDADGLPHLAAADRARDHDGSGRSDSRGGPRERDRVSEESAVT